ncbi:hypothetical protein ACFPM0_16440 [Pseudonocardia sulfidoxydans]|uniref:hypothetical protein n=1 Tax=Pseudonocardia sulfidoxydans TaxID=54011 RepID=UPI0036155073
MCSAGCFQGERRRQNPRADGEDRAQPQLGRRSGRSRRRVVTHALRSARGLHCQNTAHNPRGDGTSRAATGQPAR